MENFTGGWTFWYLVYDKKKIGILINSNFSRVLNA